MTAFYITILQHIEVEVWGFKVLKYVLPQVTQVKAPDKCTCKCSVTDQGQRHAHDDGSEDEVESGDTEQVAVRVWVRVDILILPGQHQTPSTAIFHLGWLKVNDSDMNITCDSVFAASQTNPKVLQAQSHKPK